MAQQMNKDLSKDLRSLRHRAAELSKAIHNIFYNQRQQMKHVTWNSFINQCSIISQQLLLLQTDFEKGILTFPSKFMVQPLHEHFDCEILGVKKMPQIESNIMQYTQPLIKPQNYIDYVKSLESRNESSNNRIRIKLENENKDNSKDDDESKNDGTSDEWSELDRLELMTRIADFNEMLAQIFEKNREISNTFRRNQNSKNKNTGAGAAGGSGGSGGVGMKKEIIKQEKTGNKNKKENDISMKREKKQDDGDGNVDDDDSDNDQLYNMSKEEEEQDYAQKVVSFMFSGEMPRHRVRYRIDQS